MRFSSNGLTKPFGKNGISAQKTHPRKACKKIQSGAKSVQEAPMKLLTVRKVAETLGMSLSTLRMWMRTGKSPFPFKILPSGRIVISEEDFKKGLNTLPLYTRRSSDEHKENQ
jgi:predicted DNA-binding transcriptional regulator AlpA